MEDEDSFAPKVSTDRVLACSHAVSHRKIVAKPANQCHAEVKVGLQDRDQVGDKAGGQVGDQVRNQRKHRTPMLLPNQLSKTRQKNRRTNNAETNKQYNSPASLPI